MMRYSIGDEDTELFSEHRTPGGAVRNVVTEAPRSANYRLPPPKQAEVSRTPEECHNGAPPWARLRYNRTHVRISRRKTKRKLSSVHRIPNFISVHTRTGNDSATEYVMGLY